LSFCLVPAEIKLRTIDILVFLPLISNILFCSFAVYSDCSDEIASAPERFLGKWFLVFGEFKVCSDSTFSLEESHDRSNTMFGWYGENHVNVVWTSMRLDYLYLFLLCEFSDNLSDSFSDIPIEILFTVFGNNDYMIDTFPGSMVLMIHRKGVIEKSSPFLFGFSLRT